MATKTISIIIPVLNEEDHLGLLLEHLSQFKDPAIINEIIVVDGGSEDTTVELARSFGATVLSSRKGRAAQMNFGASKAKGEILYFLHADTFPPLHFEHAIVKAVNQGHQAGCFRMKFNIDSAFLRFFSWFSRVNLPICRGGDQSLFITKQLFKTTGGFNEHYLVYEDNEYISRLYKTTRFKILREEVETSARKYQALGMMRLQYHFGVIHLKNYLGAPPEELFKYYRRNIVG